MSRGLKHAGEGAYEQFHGLFQDPAKASGALSAAYVINKSVEVGVESVTSAAAPVVQEIQKRPLDHSPEDLADLKIIDRSQ